jgi:hypothetical protein
MNGPGPPGYAKSKWVTIKVMIKFISTGSRFDL